MKYVFSLVLLLLGNGINAQNGQFIDYFRLQDIRCTEGLADDLLKAAYAGKIQAYNWGLEQPERMVGADISNKLRIKQNEDYYPWDPMLYYLPGDRVTYEGKTWECLNDVTAGKYPNNDGEDWIAINPNLYYLGSDIDELRVQYSLIKGKRLNEWMHLIISMNRSASFSDVHIASFKFSEIEKYLETTGRVFYSDENKALGWVTGDVYSWEDTNKQADLIKALGDYAYRDKTDCKIHISMDKLFDKLQERNELVVDPFSDEQTRSFYKLSFRWKDNVLDSIHLYYDLDSPIRVADIPNKPFQKSLKKSNGDSFSGFVDLATALENKILEPMKRDTLASQLPTNSEMPLTKSGKKPITDYEFKQTVFCPLNKLGNEYLQPQTSADNVGTYMLKAIRAWRFDNDNKVYQNDSLTSLISRADLMERLTYQESTQDSPWDPTAAYMTEDVVLYAGKRYRCLVDNSGAKAPPEAPELWQFMSNQIEEFSASDFSAIGLHYKYRFKSNGQILSRQIYAITIYGFLDYIGMYKPLFTVSAPTFKTLLDGAQGARLWNVIEQGKLTGYVTGASPVIGLRQN